MRLDVPLTRLPQTSHLLSRRACRWCCRAVLRSSPKPASKAGQKAPPGPTSPVFGSASLTRDSSLRDLTAVAFAVPRSVIDPRSQWKVAWDVFVGVLIVFSVLSVPYFLGFNQVRSHATYASAYDTCSR